MSKDYEKQIEDALITVLGNSADLANYAIRRWRDASQSKTYPVIVVHCSPVAASDASPRKAELIVATAEIAVRTYMFDDKNRAVINQIFSYVRDTLTGSTFLADLTAAGTGLKWRGADLSSGACESDTDNINVMSQSIECYIQTV